MLQFNNFFFSKLNLIKSYLRSTISQEKLNTIFILPIENETISQEKLNTISILPIENEMLKTLIIKT